MANSCVFQISKLKDNIKTINEEIFLCFLNKTQTITNNIAKRISKNLYRKSTFFYKQNMI